MTSHEHEARSIPLAERVAYATVVGSMAAADDVVAPAELSKLKSLCKELGLPEGETQKVVVTAESRNGVAAERAMTSLASSDLRFTLYTDCLMLAYADDKVVEQEREMLRAIAKALDIDDEKAKLLEEYVTVARDAARPGADQKAAKARAEALAGQLATLGIPVGAVALTSAAWLSAAGITTGLAAVGAGLGIATGFGAVVGLGVGTLYGVRWLHHKLVQRSPEEIKYQYMHPGARITLREGETEFHSTIPGLLADDSMSSDKVKELFRHHDRCHVVFGCDTTTANEGFVDTWTIFGTDIDVKVYFDYLKSPEVKKLFEEVGFVRSLLESIRSSPRLFEVFMNARAMKKRWPFFGSEAYLDTPLEDIREEFGIVLV